MITIENRQTRQFLLLILLFAIVLGVVEWAYVTHMGASQGGILIIKSCYMLTPAFSVFVIEKWRVSVIIKKYRITLKGVNWRQGLKYLLLTGLILPIIMLLLIYVFGDLFGLHSFGEIIGSSQEMLPHIRESLPSIIVENKYILWGIALPVMLILSMLAGVTANMILALGEEIGWRGFLEQNIVDSRIKKNLTIGVIWGLWHTPLILMGHNFGEYHLLGIIMMVIACIALQFLFSYSLIQSKSLLIPAALHGVFNGFAGLFTINLLIIPGNPLLSAPLGLLGVTSIFILLVILKKGTGYDKIQI